MSTSQEVNNMNTPNQSEEGDSNSFDGKVEKGGIVVQGREARVEINQYYRDSSSETKFPDLAEVIAVDDFEPETILIPEGPFWMGSDTGRWEGPRHEVPLPAYRIGKYPVTNAQYAYYVEQTGSGVSEAMRWKGLVPPDEKSERPVLGVTLIQAKRYCEWLSKVTKNSNSKPRSYSLPNEAQWEKACRGSYEGISFPGPILEWTRTLWGKPNKDPEYKLPWDDRGRNNLNASFRIARVVRGGVIGEEDNRQCTARRGRSTDDPGTAEMLHGFRVVLEL